MTNEPTKPSVLEVLLLVQSDRSVGHLSDYTQNALAAAVNALTKPADSPAGAGEAVCGYEFDNFGLCGRSESFSWHHGKGLYPHEFQADSEGSSDDG